MIYEICYNPDERTITPYLISDEDKDSIKLDFRITRYWQNLGDWAYEQGYTAYCVFDKAHIIEIPKVPLPPLPSHIILHIFGWDNQYYMIPYESQEGWWIYDSRKEDCYSVWVQSFEEAVYQIEQYEGQSLFPPEIYVDSKYDYPYIPDNPDREYQQGDYPFNEYEWEDPGIGIYVPEDLMRKPYINIQVKFVAEESQYYSINIIEMEINSEIA